MLFVIALGLLILIAVLVHAVIPRLIERRLNGLSNPRPYGVSSGAAQLHQNLFIADMHADSLLFGRDLLRRGTTGHVDVPRLVEGNVALQVLTVVTLANATMNVDRNRRRDGITLLAVTSGWPPRTWSSLRARALYQAASFESTAVRSRGALSAIHSRAEMDLYLERRKSARGITAGVLGLEGAHALEGRLENLDVLFAAGFRLIGLTHFFDNEVGGSAHGEHQGGITEFGRKVVRRMEELHMTVDLAHASAKLMEDVLSMATRPVVVSHTGVRGTEDNNRNLTDAQLRAVAQTGGVIGIGFWRTATGGDDSRAIARAIRYAADVVGPDHVGLGSDFDGSVRQPFDATGVARITEALMDSGMSAADIAKVMGDNVLRVLGANLPPV